MSDNYDFDEMNNATLSAAGVLLVDGRQYEGIEEEKDAWIEEARQRLNDL